MPIPWVLSVGLAALSGLAMTHLKRPAKLGLCWHEHSVAINRSSNRTSARLSACCSFDQHSSFWYRNVTESRLASGAVTP